VLRVPVMPMARPREPAMPMARLREPATPPAMATLIALATASDPDLRRRQQPTLPSPRPSDSQLPSVPH
jgi:hypothetical protein